MSNRYLAHFLEGGVPAEVASGTGAAAAATGAVEASVTSASGTGEAYNATISFETALNADAEVATGSGSAFGAAASVSVNSGLASGSGASHNPVVATTTVAIAGHASGTGAAHNKGTNALAQLASGTGAAFQLQYSSAATGVGAAYNAFAINFTATAPLNVPSGGASSEATVPLSILYDGIDIAADVLRQTANFTSAANGSVGRCVFRVRDDGHTYSFTVGRNLKLVIDGENVWQGYVQTVRRGFFMTGSEKSTDDRERYFEIQGVDLNVLFQRRYLYKKSDPTALQLTTYPAGTADDVVVKAYVANHLDLTGDAITTTMVEHVGTPAVDTEISGAASWSWGQFMAFVSRNVGSVWYIDPDRQLVLTDVDVPNAPFDISDNPAGAQIGCREMEIDYDATKMTNDALVWGAGQGADHIVFKRVQDATSIATHNRWQIGQFNQTAWRQTTIDRIANSHVYGSPQSKRGGKDDGVAVRCVVFEPGFRVGQKVIIESETYGYTDTLPIRSMDVDFLPGGQPRYRLTLSHEIDPPWDIFEFWMPAFPNFVFPDIKGGGGIDIGPIGPIEIDWDLGDPWGPFDGCLEIGGFTAGALMGLPGFGSNCGTASETFSRSGEGDSWGTSEFGGEWDTSGLGTFEVDGNYGRAQNSGSGLDPAVLTGLEGRFSTDIEILAHVIWPFDGHGVNSGMRIYDPSNEFGTYVAWSIIIDDEDSFTFRLEEFGDDTGNTIDVLVNEGWTPAFGDTPGWNDVWVRVRFEDAIARFKVWRDDQSEPASYTSRSFTGADISTWAPSFGGMAVDSGITVLGGPLAEWMEWDIITFVSGMDDLGACVDCGDPGAGIDDVAEGEVCENLARVEFDIDGDSHYRATSQFEPRTTRVWVDGRLIRRVSDYVESPFLGRIEILSHVDVGGTGPMDPSKVVHACYQTAVIESLDPPVPI